MLLHEQGKYAGLYQILGTDDQLLRAEQLTTLPMCVAPVQFVDHEGAARLDRIHKHYILYREALLEQEISQ